MKAILVKDGDFAYFYTTYRDIKKDIISEIKSDRVSLKEGNREEIIQKLAHEYMYRFEFLKYHSHYEKLKEWQEKRNFLKNFEGNLNKYDDYYKKPILHINNDIFEYITERLNVYLLEENT